MAEQEACTDLVEQASQDQSTSTIDGESLLLPLLQGLLETPEKDQICCDSGTESGEDQRNGLIAEVQNALEKLSASLITGATDITPERRSSLLELVNKLQAGLATTTPLLDRQLSVGGPARFNRRRNRRARHTVGVSSEELANARRLMEEIASCEPAGAKLLLQKQSSDSSVSSSSPFNKYGSKAVVNAVAKPFNSSSNASSSVQTPTEPLEDTDNDTVVENEPAEVVLQVNPIYTEPKDGVTFHEDEAARGTRFNTRSKKLKMKRANTIDIPKPLNFYEAEDDSDASETEAQKRKNEYYALRGPIRVANPSVKAAVPVFEPKTQSDQKFLALIGRNNGGTSGEARKLWAGQNNTAVWSSKFGNIRHNFERPAGKSSSAMRFWKTQDDNVSHSSKQYGPTISKESARNLQQMFEEKQRQNHLQQLPAVSRPIPVKNSVPQPVNQFSHAPQSAFKPIPKKPQAEPVKIQPIFKQELKADKEKTLFLYSPKPLTTYSCTSEVVSPVNPKPWVTNSIDHGGRVSSLVSSKFEALPLQDHVVRPRRVSRELGVVFHPQQAQPEKTAAPYMAPGENSLIKRLSKQYDSKVEDIASSLTPASRKPNPFRSSMQPPKVTVDECENRAVQIYQHVPGKESSAPPKLQTQVSNESLHEYNAISSRVMSGPVSQQAVTVQQNKPMNRNEHDMRAAFDLKSALQNVSRPTAGASFESKQPLERKTCGIVKPMQQKPAGNVIYNNLALSRRESDRALPQVSALSKSDSWHQICLANQGMLELGAPKNVVRSKSSHSLAVPQKQFEAGFTKEELSRKKQTVEAYFTGSKAPDVEAVAAKPAKRSINRLKTSEKISAQRSSGLSRSRTLPDMVVPQLLDESNVDKAFEDLFMSIS